MSDIYANQDLFQKVRYNRGVKEDGAEWQDRDMNICGNEEDTGADRTHFQSQGEGK